MREVLNVVAAESAQSASEISGQSRRRHYTASRCLAIRLMREMREMCANASLEAIGRFMGRDQSTAHQALRRADELMGDVKYRVLYLRCRQRLSAMQLLSPPQQAPPHPTDGHARNYKFYKPEYDAPPEFVERECLRCRDKFTAEGRYIRVCRRCKNSESWQSGWHDATVGPR